MTPEAIRSVMSLPPREAGPRVAPARQESAIPGDSIRPAAAAAIDHMQLAIAAAAEVKRVLQQKESELTIDFDQSLGRAVFRLINTATGEVVRQIPSPEMLAIARALADEARSGVWVRTDA